MNAPAVFGSYRVFHQTGSGVQGPVFRAFDSRQDRLVAIKAFHLDLTPERVVRLADALRALVHVPPAGEEVVAAIDAGIEGTTPFLVMPCQTGEPLDGFARRDAPLSIEDALPVLTALARAIDRSAAVGLHHGNLHPRDVFVEDDTVRVTGFGIAEAFARAGVPPVLHRAYAAPERAALAAWDTRADVYSLGMIAHELLTGARTTGGGEQDGTFAPSTSPEQRVQLRRVLALALAERADDRFQSGATFAEALAMVAERKRVFPPVAAVASAPVVETVSTAPSDPTPRVTVAEHAPGVAHADTDVLRLMPAMPVAGRARSRRARGLIGLAAVGAVAVAIGSGLAFVTLSRPGEVLPSPPVVLDRHLPDEHREPASDVAPAVAAPRTVADAAVDLARPVRLEIRSEPAGALVTIDGRRSGETPMAVRYEPGTYVVRVARPGFVPREGRVTLASPRTLTFALEPAVVASGSALGWLDIDSRPRGAAVRIDGRLLGPAPLRVPSLRPGPHELSLELGGYERVTRQVDVAAGQPSAVHVMLQSLVR